MSSSVPSVAILVGHMIVLLLMLFASTAMMVISWFPVVWKIAFIQAGVSSPTGSAPEGY